MMVELNAKYDALKGLLKKCGSIIVAFSGGVDSTLLLKVASDELAANCLAVTVRSPVMNDCDIQDAQRFCKENDIPHKTIELNPLEIPGFAQNPADRCYICKKELFNRIAALSKQEGFAFVADGSNKDDLSDYRPGLKALQELEVLSPLQQCGFTKEDVRELSGKLELSTAQKPSFACLASRFAYGEEITAEMLEAVRRAELFLHDYGIPQLRVRVHQKLARIEVPEEYFDAIMEKRDSIHKYFLSLGFLYVTLDLHGFQSGSMNRVLETER